MLVLDWLMPGVTGIEVCKYLRSSPATLEMPVLLMTAQREIAQIVEGLRAGANDYLTKPYAAEELRARVGALARSKALRERAEEAEAFLRTLLASLPDAVLLVNPAGQVSFANDEALRVLAPTAERIVGRARSRSWCRASVSRRRTRAASLPDVHIGSRRCSSRSSGRSSPRRGMSLTISLRDVTEKRRRESRRLDFYSMVAHDLRTPLERDAACASTGSSPAAGAAPAGGPERRAEDRGATSATLVALINDFLDLARMESVGLVIDAAGDRHERARPRRGGGVFASSREASSLDLRASAAARRRASRSIGGAWRRC